MYNFIIENGLVSLYCDERKIVSSITPWFNTRKNPDDLFGTDDRIFLSLAEIDGNSALYRDDEGCCRLTLSVEDDGCSFALKADGEYNSESHTQVFMNKPCLRAELELTYIDGERKLVKVIGTDEKWYCRFSPYTDNDIQFGERYDARLSLLDWCDPASSDDCWHKCATVYDSNNVFTLRSYPPRLS